MMKPSNQSNVIEITSSLAGSKNNAKRSTDCKAIGSGPLGPAALIFAAWVAGTLMFEISALENVRSESVTEHWGNQATMLKTWTTEETELAAVRSTIKGPDHDAQRRGRQYDVETNPTARTAQTSPLVVNAASVSNSPLDSSRVELSSHQAEVHRLGLQFPRMELPSVGEYGGAQSASAQE